MEARTSYLARVLGENPEAKMAVREVPYFRECSQELLELVYHYGRIFSLRENEKLTRENEFDQWVYFVLRGRLNVFVGGERVDSIASSLVGERCLLGEPRKATLTAAEGGILALGVDMALMDVLQGAESDREKNAGVVAEMLSIIAGEIVNRVAQLSYHQIDVSNKFQTIRKAEQISNLIRQLASNYFLNDPRVNMEVRKFLGKTDKSLLAACLINEDLAVDTRRLYSRCINTGRYALVTELAESLAPILRRVRPEGETRRDLYDGWNFFDLSNRIRETLNAELCGGDAHPDRRPISSTEWEGQFKLGENLEIDFGIFSRWLKTHKELTDLEVIDAINLTLSEASRFTGEINGAIKNMVTEMSEMALLSRLGEAVANPEGFLLEFINSRTPEEMIPIFSKHVLDVHLVKPYLEALGIAPDGSAEEEPLEGGDSPTEPPAQKSDSGQTIADSLFD